MTGTLIFHLAQLALLLVMLFDLMEMVLVPRQQVTWEGHLHAEKVQPASAVLILSYH
jgi:hypothetical protein